MHRQARHAFRGRIGALGPAPGARFGSLPIIVVGLLLATLGGCSRTSRAEVTARVGEIIITPEDVAYRQAVTEVRSGEAIPAPVALFQLLEEALMAEVGRRYDVVVSEEMLAQEAVRVQTESRDPQMLARIRAVFGEDQAAYRRLVLKPILVNQLLHARFSLGHDIQAEPLARAQEVLAAGLTAPASLPALAEAFGAEYQELEVADGRIRYGEEAQQELPPALTQYVQWFGYDRGFVVQVVDELEVGELHPRVVEDRHTFMVVRLLSEAGEDAQLESVVVDKLAFGPWFQAQSQRVEMKIADQALKEALLAEVDVPYMTDRLSTGE